MAPGRRPWTVLAMATNTTYRSAELAARMDLLLAAPGFHPDAIDHDAAYAVTLRETQAEEQNANAATLKKNLQSESDYALTSEPTSASGDCLDLALSKRPGRRRLGNARPPAPVEAGANEGEGDRR